MDVPSEDKLWIMVGFARNAKNPMRKPLAPKSLDIPYEFLLDSPQVP
jgi:hypothetical protein